MPAAVPVAIALFAGAEVAKQVESNQERQHAKGAAQAQADLMRDQVARQDAADKDTGKRKSDTAIASQTAAIAAIKAAMSGSSNMGGTILNSGVNQTPAPIATKTLLGA